MVGSGETVGTINAIYRFAIKSMAGEELDAVEVSERGLAGDRGRALVDRASGAVVSAKNPRKWPTLLDCRATYPKAPQADQPTPAVHIALPDGTSANSDDADVEQRLSQFFGREVALATTPPAGQQIEMMLPEDPSEMVLEVPIPPGTFFDEAAVHLLSTASLRALEAAAPDSNFDIRRFRPNLLIDAPAGSEGFVDNAWIGQTLAIGEVRLAVVGPCPRCIMTTVPQGDLPKDAAVLRTAAEKNNANVGVYARVVTGGKIRRGDKVTIA